MLNTVKNEIKNAVELNVENITSFVEEVAYNGQLLSEVVGLVVSTLEINNHALTKYNKYAYLYEAELTRLVTEWLISNNLVTVQRKVFKRTQESAEPVYELIDTVNDSKAKYEKEYVLPTTDKREVSIKGHRSLKVRVSPEHFFNPEYRVVDVSSNLIKLYSFLKYIKNEESVYDRYSYKALLENGELMYENLRGMSQVLYSKKDSRGRSYPTLNMGIVAHYGDHFQSRMFEYVNERTATVNDVNMAKWLLHVELNGRMPMREAVTAFSLDDATNTLEVDREAIVEAYKTMEAYPTMTRRESKGLKDKLITPNTLGDALYKQNLLNLIKDGVGSKTRMMLEIDMTNSGLVILANNLGNSKMLTLANMVDESKVHDSHGTLRDEMNKYGKEFNRNDSKPINTALLHGGSINSMSNSSDINIDTLNDVLMKTYGIGYKVPNAIVKLNKQLVTKGITNPSFKLPDDYIAYSTSYSNNVSIPTTNGNIKSVTPYYIYAHSSQHKISGLFA